MSHYIQKYELTQNDLKYILSTQIEGEYIKLVCKEFGGVTNPCPPAYIGLFSLIYLQQLCEIFYTIPTIFEALELINQTVENQKICIEHVGNNIDIFFYFTTESEEEDSLEMKLELVNEAIYNKPKIYQSFVQSPSRPAKEVPTYIKSKTTESAIGAIYSPLKRLPDTQNNLPQLKTITTPTKEAKIMSSNETYQNYENINLNDETPIDYQNYENIKLNDETPIDYQNYENIKLNDETPIDY